MNIKARKKLGFRMTAYCIVFAAFLSLFVGGLGVLIYYRSSMTHYENYLHAVLDIVKENLDADELEKTIHYSQKNAAYERTKNEFNYIKQTTGIEYIYLMTQVSESGYEYIACGFTAEELGRPESLVQLGDPVGEEIEPKMIPVFDQISSGEIEMATDANTSDLGYVMTLAKAFKNSHGEIIGVLAADILMDDIIRDVTDYIRNVLLGTVLGMMVFLCFFLYAVKRKIITPIITIGKHLSDFVSQTGSKPSEMEVKEIQIRTSDELEQLSGQLNSMMKDMVAYMSGLESMTAIQERMNVQLDLARQIQQSMLPDTFPAFPERTEFDIYAVMCPAGEVGGDFYDFFLIDGTHLGVVIADVSGEGVPAALFMMRCKTLIKNYARLGLEPAKVFFDTNNEMCEGNDANMTVEAFMGILDVYSGEFLYANAGEHRPYVIDSVGQVKEIPVSQGFLLGALENIPFYQEKIVLKKKEVLCLFTNGIFRMQNGEGVRQDVEGILQKHISGHATINEIAEAITWECDAGLGDGEKNEDLTMVMLMFEGYAI